MLPKESACNRRHTACHHLGGPFARCCYELAGYDSNVWLLQRRCVGGRLIHQGLEGLGLVHGQIGEDLAVDLDPGLGKPADKSAVGQTVEAAACVDALDPEGAEIALLLLAADIVVLQRAIGRGIGRGDRVLAAAVEALGLLEDALAARMAGNGTGSPGHLSLPQPYGIQRLTRWVSDSDSTAVPRRSRVRAGELLIKRWRLPTWPVLILPLAVNLKRFLAPDLVFILGILLSSGSLKGSGAFMGRHGMPCRAARKRAGSIWSSA